ncbi:hypothetical protein [Deefgea salmonis]|uniref:Uncharacterized protein n=1 Tax=Deefgea salmonis TaxID=2875502 RepID=A0ABS8BMH4_9NEIS|nr:hypothetical protein [Deefgea salmonis]MCB5196916.1 hypothetical protein [Deefgea salmonis]
MKKIITTSRNLFFISFPFVHLLGFEQRKKVDAEDFMSEKNLFYYELDNKILTERLKEEHTRSKTIDDKTSKFNLGLSLCLTAIGVIANTTTRSLPNSEIKPFIIALLSLSPIYMLIGGIVSLMAFKLMPTYGYGSIFEYRKSKNERIEIIKALIGQENINLIKQVNNEIAYQCIRNGFIIFLIALIITSIATIQEAYLTSPSK